MSRFDSESHSKIIFPAARLKQIILGDRHRIAPHLPHHAELSLKRKLPQKLRKVLKEIKYSPQC